MSTAKGSYVLNLKTPYVILEKSTVEKRRSTDNNDQSLRQVRGFIINDLQLTPIIYC